MGSIPKHPNSIWVSSGEVPGSIPGMLIMTTHVKVKYTVNDKTRTDSFDAATWGRVETAFKNASVPYEVVETVENEKKIEEFAERRW